jgi:sugar-specific transcriptional regulator TrmB
MSSDDAIAALKRLGLPNYEARVFVALQALGSGTAQAVSDRSGVPRSQVYGAADELADRGLLEIVESSPKAYRPVKLATARDLLSERLEREQTRAFENLASIQATDTDRATSKDVSTLRGRRPIDDRIAALVETADHTVVFVAPTESHLADDIANALDAAGHDDVDVTVVTAARSLADRFADAPIDVFVMSEDNPADFAGRALMIDDETVLLAAETDDDPVEEEALWTGDSSIGRILAQFMQSGMESGRERKTDESPAR